ncbi:glutamate 5-kinase [Aquibacillus koreensis]|uniref:Glutamate 5-kinase n=1 Tax=Aquibacillus koreensis TaxID=279446 RepID=A0A9X4AJ20_9BACI|nr:glutamate 5-kinase [Aquibacillus koreensis]MCT2536350.1 glutamate 5-kinase [Aquibacillus koreensis]MDC3421299.1 glutamate 5-kinase [Aquibacillus koreensis]
MAKKRIVVKIGSSSLTDKYGSLSLEKVQEHTAALAALKQHGYEVILISSGAVSAGFSDLGYPTRPVTVSGKQAAAAVGQGLLVQAYTEAFRTFNIVAAQLLITRDVFINQEQFTNVYATLSELLKRSVIPIINENDSVAIDELTFGDNDMLSALVSGLVNADFLVMLTDINGLYDDNPNTNPLAKRYEYLDSISEQILTQTRSESGSKFGTGGMKSKILAAQTALSLGVNVFVGTGSGPSKLLDVMKGNGDGTYIGDKQTHSYRKQKQWIAFHSSVNGKIFIDEGAERAIIKEGKSLLPAGIIAIDGSFQAGDVVEVAINKRVIAKGQVNYSAEELQLIKGMASQKAMTQTNHKKPEVIHRDRLVISVKEDFYE